MERSRGAEHGCGRRPAGRAAERHGHRPPGRCLSVKRAGRHVDRRRSELRWPGHDRTHLGASCGRQPAVASAAFRRNRRGRAGVRCASNDIVMSTSSNGTAWSPVVRIPIDDTTSAVDHFIPGLAVDKATAGSSAHLGLTYYYYPQANCSTSTCQLDVGFISSGNGGASWSTPMQLAGPMSLGWLARTNQGAMVADYISTSFAGGT